MRITLLVPTLVASLAFASVASAQSSTTTPRPGAERRAEMRERVRDASPDERRAAMEQRKERRENLTPDQQEWAKAFAEQMKSVREGVREGTLTRESAAAQLKAWREQNARPRGN